MSDNNKLHPVNSSETSPEKKTGLKRKTAALMLGVMALSGVAACGNGVEQVAQAKPVATAEATPSSTAPDILPTASPTKGTEYYSRVVEKLNMMDVSQFELLPRDERLPFAQFLIDQSIQRGIYDQIYGPGKPDAQYAHTYTKASLDNTGQELIDNDLFKLQVAYMQFVEGDTKPYDAVEGQKVLSAVYWDVGGKVVMNDYLDSKQQEQTLSRITPLANKYTAVNTSTLQNYTDINGVIVPSKIVTLIGNNNNVQYERFVYHENLSYDGKTRADWYAENITDSLAGLN